MNKAERKELADQVRIAAWGVEVDHCYTCNALGWVTAGFESADGVMKLYQELFMLGENAHDKPWFGPLSLKDRVGGSTCG